MNAATPRPVRREDLPRLVTLMAAAEAVDHTEEFFDLDDLVELFENPMLDPAYDWIVLERDGEVVATSLLWPRAPADGAIDLHVDGVVHPRWRGQGLGSLMLPLMVARARAYVAERGADLTPVIRAATASDNTAAEQLLTGAGFEPERWNFLMTADLAGIDTTAGEVPEGCTISTWEGVDPDEVRAAHNLAFGGYHPGFTLWDAEMWAHHVSDSRAFRPALSLLLRDDRGVIAAYLQTSEYDATREATGLREAFVAKLGTSPEHRRRGLATLLLARGLELYRAEGFDRAALDVDTENPTGALGVYERAGFVSIRRFTHYLVP